MNMIHPIELTAVPVVTKNPNASSTIEYADSGRLSSRNRAMNPSGIVIPRSKYLTTHQTVGVASYDPLEVDPVEITSTSSEIHIIANRRRNTDIIAT